MIFIIIVIVVVIAFAIIGYNVNERKGKMGLSVTALNGEKELTPEEIIKLYYYYSNKNDETIKELLYTPSSHYWGDDQGVDTVVEIRELSYSDEAEEMDVYEVRSYDVEYNSTLFLYSDRRTNNTESIVFTLMKVGEDSEWIIYSIGNG